MNTQDLLTTLLVRARSFHSARAIQVKMLTSTERGWVLIANVETHSERCDRVFVFRHNELTGAPELDGSYYC